MNNSLFVWGVGHIGFSDMIYYAQEGLRVIGIDIEEDKWGKICAGEELSEIKYWIGFDYNYLLNSELISFSSNPNKLSVDFSLGHLICVPTEKNGEPWDEPLWDVVHKILSLYNRSSNSVLTVIIESTLVPGTANKVLDYLQTNINHGELYFGVSPRRDWFVSGGKTLKSMPRVYGCNSDNADKYIHNLLGIVCRELIKADDYQQAEMTKSVENAIRHVGITLANQLSDAFPEIDTRKVLELAATKWNVELYYPSIGIGGYCIPLSSKYLLSADKNNKLTIFQETIGYNIKRTADFGKLILDESISSIGILGICYTGNVRVVKSSVIFEIIGYLANQGVDALVNDSLFTENELRDDFNFQPLYLDGSNQVDGLILFSGHRQYSMMSVDQIEGMLKGRKIIWDNTALWEKYHDDFIKRGIMYRVIGRKGWRRS